ARDERVVAEIAVLAEDGVAQEEIAQRVHSENIDDGFGADDIAFGFAHLGLIHEEPAMRPDLLRNRQHCGHQECGPVHCVKADDVFTYDVHVGWPEAATFVFRAADGGEIGSEGVEPDVENVRFLTGNGNTPTDGGAGDAEIFQATFDEAYDFVAARFRLDEVWILLVEIEQRLLECGKLEEIVFFRDRFRRAAAIGTVFAGLHVHIGVVVDAILPDVVAFVDVVVLAAAAEEPLHGADVREIGGADEFVRGNAEFFPERFPGFSHAGDKFGFRDAGFLRGALDVDAVLIGAGGHDHVEAAHALKPAHGVADDGGVDVADVRQAVGVVDRRRQIVFGLRRSHFSFSSFGDWQGYAKERQSPRAPGHSDLAQMGRSMLRPYDEPPL